ncbi:PREDICTED: methyltransferase-like protein 25 [Rhagoletis zephyria]|uniref:methyltransferase-like protein 25 n=1 Tax=Rhagoletis zephyria TaxID=28612 RepID=UPI0008112D03|nr:PREDICTED: methyltransferase-like protein 25 [Rhagoletis zephyria]
MSIGQIRARLEEILQFMQPHWEFVNCHMVSYLTEKYWQRYMPDELKIEVPDVESVQSCIETVFWKNANKGVDTDEFSGFKRFLGTCERQRLDKCVDLLTPMEVLFKELGLAADLEQNLSIKEFMSEKKRHEVEITATLVDRLIQSSVAHRDTTEVFVVDAGDGKGYLSSRLALQYGHRVLGIDFQELNTESALERNRKLQRVWNGLVKRSGLQQQGLTPARCGKKPATNENISYKPVESLIKQGALYKTTAAFITPDINISELLKQHFPDAADTSYICLTGLHTCGNLAPTCLRVFHEQAHCKLICNIGCCYHLLQEEYAKPEYFENEKVSALQTSTGFPMSQFLRDKGIALGRNARMLATQSLERVTSERSLMNISLYYRALLEVLIWESASDLKQKVQVGKIRKYSNFSEYIELCSKKLSTSNADLHWSAESIERVQQQYAFDAHYMHLFHLMRMCFAQVLESLILLDRLLYLKELGYEKSYLLSVFDAVISPRRFGIIAVKDADR